MWTTSIWKLLAEDPSGWPLHRPPPLHHALPHYYVSPSSPSSPSSLAHLTTSLLCSYLPVVHVYTAYCPCTGGDAFDVPLHPPSQAKADKAESEMNDLEERMLALPEGSPDRLTLEKAFAVKKVEFRQAQESVNSQCPTPAHLTSKVPECESEAVVAAKWGVGNESYNATECCRTHSTMRDILISLVAFFDANGIEWYLDGGTLIGNLRHDGALGETLVEKWNGYV